MIYISNREFMFSVFSLNDVDYMTVTTGGVAQYDITVKLDAGDVDLFLKDNNRAIAMSTDIITRTSAYSDRIVHPPIDPQ